MHCICFSGHRNAVLSGVTEALMLSEMETMIKRGYRDFYAGGALGWDTICEKAVINFKKRRFKISLHLILPCCFEEQTRNWSEEEKMDFLEVQHHSDTIEYISEHYTDKCMKQRNQRLVDSAGIMWCYYDKKRFRSGTGQTVRMAEKSGLRIWNFYVEAKSAPQSPNQNRPA